jgi:hypothetical protein
MLPKLKSAGFAAVVLAVGVVGSVGLARNVQAHDGCHRVRGHYTASQTTSGCTSPTGICFSGEITHGGFLDSTSMFIELDQAPSAGMPLTEPGTTISYSGTVTLTTSEGSVTMRDLGVIDGARLAFTEMERPVGGTGEFTNASHTFFINGAMNSTLTAFDGQLEGEICGLAHEHH